MTAAGGVLAGALALLVIAGSAQAGKLWPAPCPTKAAKACLARAKRAKNPELAVALAATAYVRALKRYETALAARAREVFQKVSKAHRKLPALEGQLRGACKRADTNACLVLGFFLLQTKRYAEVAPPLRRACAAKDSYACLALATEHEKGRGAAKDQGKAIAMLQKACTSGNMYACTNLAYDYGAGHGVPKNRTKAIALLRKACRGKDMLGCNNLAMELLQMPKARDTKRAIALLRRACDGGEMNGCLNLAGRYHDAAGVPRNWPKALALFRRACDNGKAVGCFYQALMLSRGGHGVKKRAARAKKRFRRACQGGYAKACARARSR
ncbi:MAG: sel1 repeat family protein [Myxococcales bacterium]|nr:sel1 repeat family protein [Myxococcales bacterium]